MKPGPPSGTAPVVKSAYVVQVSTSRDSMTLKRRVSLSESAVAPAPFEAAIVMAWSPGVRFWSGTATSSNAVPRRVVAVSPSDAEVTVNVTGSPSRSPDPYARRRMIGRSLARYSGAIVASTKNGSPTGTRMNADPASGTEVIASALTCQDVRSSDSLNATWARPCASVTTCRNRTESTNWERPSPPPVVSP